MIRRRGDAGAALDGLNNISKGHATANANNERALCKANLGKKSETNESEYAFHKSFDEHIERSRFRNPDERWGYENLLISVFVKVS